MSDTQLPVRVSESFRKVDVPATEQVLGCVGDAWIRTIHWVLPRYCDGQDMKDYQLSVHFVNADGDAGVFEATESTYDANGVEFDWVVSPVATAVKGRTSASARAALLDGDEVVRQFNSEAYKWRVLDANDTDYEEVVEYFDPVYQLMAEWKEEIAAGIVDEVAELLPNMSTAQRGVAKVGAGLTMNNGALELDGSGDIATAVSAWLDAHPEATTTIEDNAVTIPKLNGADYVSAAEVLAFYE